MDTVPDTDVFFVRRSSNVEIYLKKNKISPEKVKGQLCNIHNNIIAKHRLLLSLAVVSILTFTFILRQVVFHWEVAKLSVAIKRILKSPPRNS